ncbi:hypothetical protein BgiMline_022203, partial [Biomphalaria glabrata]
NAVTGRHSPYSFSEEENESQHFISKEEINTTLKEFLVASLIYIGKATGTGIKFNGICYSDNEENEELLEMCKTAAKNIIALEDVETNEFQETTALAFLNKCFCRKIEQQEDLQASTNLKQLKERSTILETIHEIIYYPEKLVIKSNIEFYKASNTRIITDLQVKQRFSSKQSQIYFHGTTVEFLRDTEDAILRKGIDLGRGHAKQDFSHRDDFYMSDSLDAAIEWGRNKDRKDHCVIVFNIRDELLDARAQRGLEVSKDHAKFLKVVNYFRNGKPTSNTDFSPNELAEINNARFIKGNIWVRNNEHVFCINNTAVYQLCLKDQDYAKAIENCMCGILFYPNGIP